MSEILRDGLGAAGAGKQYHHPASTTAQGATSAAQLSPSARMAQFASQAAPVVVKSTSLLGLGLGGFELGRGLHDLTDIRPNPDRAISGGADMVTAGTLGVAAVSTGTGVGLPVAAVSLGDAGGWVGDRARDMGGAISGGASALRNAFNEPRP